MWKRHFLAIENNSIFFMFLAMLILSKLKEVIKDETKIILTSRGAAGPFPGFVHHNFSTSSSLDMD